MSKKTTNIFTTGLDLSTDPINQSKDSYSFGLNGIKENIINNPEVVSNEKGFTEYIDLGYQYILLGTRYLGKKEYVLFIKNIEEDASFNRILLVNNGDVTKTILDRTDLNFSSSHPIISTYRINYKGERLIYWVDGLNDDRVINIDIDSTVFDINLFSITTDSSKPLLSPTVLDTGGNLISGQYFISISYNIGTSYSTDPLLVSKPISIAFENYYNKDELNKNINRLFGQTDGDIIPRPTKKAIEIKLSNLDTNYDSYNIIIVRQEQSANIITVVKNISLIKDTFIYTGSEGTIDDTLTLNDIITSSINYYASEAIIQKDNRLLRANSKLKNSIINYQEYANNIVVTYKINEKLVYDLDLVNGYKTDNKGDGGFYDTIGKVASKHGISPSYLANTANNDEDNKTFMRDEIYSLGIGFELNDGTETDVYHIPGRSINTFDSTPTGVGEYDRPYSSDWDNDLINSDPRWKVRNTAIKQSLGKLSYWRSSEVYPNGYGYPNDGEKDLSNKSYIRHHKMPSDVLEPIYRTEITGDPNRNKGEETNYKIYKRNLSLDFSNIIIPFELQNLIKKVKFYYTPRNSNNRSILSKGLIYKINNLTSPYEQSTSFNYESKYINGASLFEFISPETNFNFKENSLSGNTLKICGIDKGYVNYAGQKEVSPNESGNNAYYIRTFNNQLFKDTGRQQGIISAFCFYNQRAIPKESNYSVKVNNSIYVDSNYKGNTDLADINFLGSQNTVILETIDPVYFKPLLIITTLADYYPELLYPSGTNNSTELFTNININLPAPITGSYLDRELAYNTSRAVLQNNSFATRTYYDTSMYVQLCNTKESLYGTLDDLQFIELGTLMYDNTKTSYSLNGGDTFIDLHHFKQSKNILQETEEDAVALALNVDGGYSVNNVRGTENLLTQIYELTVQSWGSFFCETDINIRMRREGQEDDEKYFPKSFYNISKLKDVSKHSDNKEFYKIETPYNNKYLKPYFISYKELSDLIDTEDIRYGTRIIYSDKQSLEDKTDNYRKVRANNYRDLPLDKGGISIFFVNQDKLYAVTRDTIFNVYTSNQSLRGLNETTITVGTGEFLGTEPIDLISIDGGFAGTSSKLSFVESPYGYLFVDRYKGKVILFTDSPINLVDKDVVEFFENNFELQAIEENEDTEFDNPLNNYGYVCGYDNLLNRFLITKLDYKTVNGVVENKSFTLSYSPIAKQWLFEHSYLPNNYIIHPNSLLTKRNDTQIKQFNKGDYGRYFDEDIKPFIIETIFNEFPTETKVFDNLTINLKSSINDISTNKFFDKVILSTEYQCSGEIELNLTNLTKKERNWMINKFSDLTNNLNIPLFSKNWNSIKDQYPIDKVVNNNKIDYNKPWFNRARFRDKFLKVRFIENNLENNKLMLNFVSAVYRPSQR